MSRRLTSQELLDRRKRDRPGALLVGAAIGAGLAARAAVRGGCDLLLALNAGKLRSMGAPSIASLLPLRDSNALVMEFGPSEILPARGELPVFFGACCFDPRQSLEALVDEIAEAGFQGITNFPSSIFFDGRFRKGVEAAGVGFARESELLRLGRARGLSTLAYVARISEARLMAEIGVDIVNLNLGWNKGGYQGVGSAFDLAEASDFARRVFRAVRSIRPTTQCMIEGGPIVSPDDMHRVCQASRADGYIGGSTIDRVPLEAAIEGAVSAFKMIGALQERVTELERVRSRRNRDYGLVGWSAAIDAVRAQVPKVARSGKPALISGPPGSGKELFARSIAAEARCREFISVTCDEWAEGSLFGSAAGVLGQHAKARKGLLEAGPETLLYLKEASSLPPTVQNRLLNAIESGRFLRLGDGEQYVLTSRLVFSETDPRLLSPRLRALLSAGESTLPPLRDRLEDIPLLVAHFLRAPGKITPRIDSGVYRILTAHDWPGNVRELRSVLERAAEASGSGMITPDHFPKLGAGASRQPRVSEREWILDALRRHRFRRGETAAHLGVSRKTLYNKMRRYRIGKGAR